MKIKKIKSTLIKVDEIIKLVNLILISGRIKGERHLSATLIADVECGKSDILALFMNFDSVIWANDLSRKIIVDELLEKMMSNKKTHIICPDFLSVLSHQKKTVKATINVLNSLVEEGIKDILFYGSVKHLEKIARGGLIFAITKNEYEIRKKYWKGIGFISRCLPITYSYSDDTIAEIHDYIESGFKERKINFVVPPKKKVKISFTGKSETKIIKLIALTKKSKYETGFRLHKHLRTLAKCIAYYNGHRSVNVGDVDEMQKLLDNYINFKYKKL